MPRIVTVPLSLEQREQLILLTKHAAHWRERQRAQTILWLSEGKTVAEVARLQQRIPETIRLQRRHWELRPTQYTDRRLSGSNLRVGQHKPTQCRTDPSQTA